MNRSLRILTCLVSSSVLLGSQALWWRSPAQAQTAGSAAGCPPGTRENSFNFVRNSNFSTNAGTPLGVYTPPLPPPFIPFPAAPDFISDLPYRGDAVYPDDGGGGGLSIQDERFNGGQIPFAPAGIVSGRGVTAQEAAQVGIAAVPIPTYLYSNPNLDQAGNPVTIPPAPPGTRPPVVWGQTVTGLAPNTVYNFKALFFNLLLPAAPGVDPLIRLQIAPPNSPTTTPPTLQTPIAITVGNGSPIPGFPGIPNVRQSWIPVQFSFTTAPGQTSLELRIVDEAQDIIGDDFGITAIGLRECIPNIGVAKQAGTPVENAGGTFTIPYTVRVRNLAPLVGNPDPYLLNNVQLTEDLSTTFANATIVSVSNLQSPDLTVNPGFNGTSNPRLLQDNVNSLAAGASGTVSFNVTIIPGTGPNGFGPFTNQVVATANSNSGAQVLDRSNDGSNVDPDGDGDPSNNDNPTVVNLPGQSSLQLVKRITNVTRNGSSLPGVNFTSFVDDPNTTVDNDPAWARLPQGSPIGIINLSNTNPVQAGDEVEYSVYFLSNGASPALSTSLCDPIPAGTSFISLTNQLQLGTGSFVSAGNFFTPLAPLPPNNSCPDPRNPNGAVIFDLGNLSNVPNDNIGVVRFRVRVN